MHLEIIKNEPALLLHEGSRRVLVVGDLHIGYERVLFKQDYYSTNLATRITTQFEQLVAELDSFCVKEKGLNSNRHLRIVKNERTRSFT